jgi:hypothetical protein
VQVEPVAQDSVGRSVLFDVVEEPLKLSAEEERARGCLSAALVKRVAVAVRVHPEPEPVASTTAYVSLPSWLRSKPLRVDFHVSVAGAEIESVPAFSVTEPVMVHVEVTLSLGLSSPVHCFAEAFDATRTKGPMARTPATSTRPAHLVDPWDLRSANMIHPLRLPPGRTLGVFH